MADGDHIIEGSVVNEERPLAVNVENDSLTVDGPLTDAELRATSVPVVLTAGVAVAGAVRFVDENGAAYGVKHIENKPRVSSMPYTYDIAEGNIADHYAVHRFGHNDAVGATDETLWDYGGVYTYSAAGVTLYVSSSAGGDTQSILATGLDANWNWQTQLVTLAGLVKTEVGAGAITWLRVFTIENQGTTDNAGDVYIYEDDTLTAGVPDTASKVRGMMDTGTNISHQAIFSVPMGEMFYMTDFFGSDVASKATYFGIWIREFGGVFKEQIIAAVKDSGFAPVYKMPFPIPAQSDIEIRVHATATAGISHGGFSGWRES